MVWQSKEQPNLAVKVNFRLVSGDTSSSIAGGAGYHNLQLVDQVMSNKAVRVVAAQSATNNGRLTSSLTMATSQQKLEATAP